MSEMITGFIGNEALRWFLEMKDEARTRQIQLSTFPIMKDDIEVEIRVLCTAEKAARDLGLRKAFEEMTKEYNEKRLQANCLRCGWYGWSDETHICEFGNVMPAMNDMMRIAPVEDIGGTLTKILAKQQQEDKRLQAIAELQEDGERMERVKEFDLTEWAKSEAERCCNSQYEHEDAINWMLAGADKALDLVMEEIKQLKSTSRRLSAIKENTNRVMGYADCMSEIQDIVSKLRGEK